MEVRLKADHDYVNGPAQRRTHTFGLPGTEAHVLEGGGLSLKRLEDEYPSAAGSVREGLEETLTVLTLQLSVRLQRSLATTNAADESPFAPGT